MTDENENKPVDETESHQNDKIVADSKRLAAQGFAKDQIAQQLSSKYAMTVEDVKAVIGKDDPEPEAA